VAKHSRRGCLRRAPRNPRPAATCLTR
jgi:hypothetical protein